MKPHLLHFFALLLLISACSEAPSETAQDITSPIFVNPEGNKTWNIFGLQIIGKIFSEDTNGAYSVIVSTTPPDGGAPPHVHEIEDELFYVLEGTMSFLMDDEWVDAPAGSFVLVPGGVLAIIDHAGDPGKDELNEKLHRIDEARV